MADLNDPKYIGLRKGDEPSGWDAIGSGVLQGLLMNYGDELLGKQDGALRLIDFERARSANPALFDGMAFATSVVSPLSLAGRISLHGRAQLVNEALMEAEKRQLQAALRAGIERPKTGKGSGLIGPRRAEATDALYGMDDAGVLKALAARRQAQDRYANDLAVLHGAFAGSGGINPETDEGILDRVVGGGLGATAGHLLMKATPVMDDYKMGAALLPGVSRKSAMEVLDTPNPERVKPPIPLTLPSGAMNLREVPVVGGALSALLEKTGVARGPELPADVDTLLNRISGYAEQGYRNYNQSSPFGRQAGIGGREEPYTNLLEPETGPLERDLMAAAVRSPEGQKNIAGLQDQVDVGAARAATSDMQLRGQDPSQVQPPPQGSVPPHMGKFAGAVLNDPAMRSDGMGMVLGPAALQERMARRGGQDAGRVVPSMLSPGVARSVANGNIPYTEMPPETKLQIGIDMVDQLKGASAQIEQLASNPASLPAAADAARQLLQNISDRRVQVILAELQIRLGKSAPEVQELQGVVRKLESYAGRQIDTDATLAAYRPQNGNAPAPVSEMAMDLASGTPLSPRLARSMTDPSVVTKQRERFYVDPASAGDGPLLVRRKMNRPNPWPASARPGVPHELAATGLAAGGEYLAHSAMGQDTVSDKLDKLIAQMGGR